MTRLCASLSAALIATVHCAASAGVAPVAGKTVKVSSFGFDPEDSTAIIQRAIDSDAATLILDRQAGPWITRPLKARSNQEIVFEDGVELVAKRGAFRAKRGDCLLSIACVTNVTLRGLGTAGGTLRMWKRDYTDPKLGYVRSEWRHALSIRGAENVRVENMKFLSSGGDGIVLGREGAFFPHRVTIRDCVCDDNHRQGISLCAGDDVLIENTVLSNTKGTPPQAGIDIEPDNPDEPICGIVLRNVVAKDNAGNGFEVYLQKLNAESRPVSIRYENCQSFGNRRGVYFCAKDAGDEKVVRGFVEYVGCEFNSPALNGIVVSGIPAGAVDVAFRNCTIRDAKHDVFFAAGHSRQGQPDGLTLENLTIYQKEAHDWFLPGILGYGPAPKNIRGNVTVISPAGRHEVKIDDDWLKRYEPEQNGGRMPLPRMRYPFARPCRAVDKHPGESVALAPVAINCGGNFLLYVSEPGRVTLAGHTRGEPASPSKTFVSEIQKDGKDVWKFEFPTPGEKGGVFSFKAAKAGYWRLKVPDTGRPFVLERSNVPVAVDVSREVCLFTPVDSRPFSLWFVLTQGREASFCAGGNPSDHFAVSVTDGAGVKQAGSDWVHGLFEARLGASASAGELFRADFSPAKGHSFGRVRADVSGVPGVLFLSSEKYWTFEDPSAGRVPPVVMFRFSSAQTHSLAEWKETARAFAENPGCCNDVWFSTGESFPGLDWHRRNVACIREAAEDMRNLGIGVSLQFEATIGHGDSFPTDEEKARFDKPWTGWTGSDGTECRYCNCPRQPGFLKRIAEVSELYAVIRPSVIWIDDDLRITGHSPVSGYGDQGPGCWCATCVAEFSKEEGRAWTREELHAAWKKDPALKDRWWRFSARSLANVSCVIARSFRKVSPETRVGFQTSSGQKAVIAALLPELTKEMGEKARVRLGGGDYYDLAPYAQIVKSRKAVINRYEMRSDEFVDSWCTEVESYPRTYGSRSVRSVALEAFSSLGWGFDSTSLFVMDRRSETDAFYSRYLLHPLVTVTEFLNDYSRANTGTLPAGFTCPVEPSDDRLLMGLPLLAGGGVSWGTISAEREKFPSIGAVWGDFRSDLMTDFRKTPSDRLQQIRDRLSGKAPLKLLSPFVGVVLPRVTPEGSLRTVGLIGTRLDSQEDIVLHVDTKCAKVVWHELGKEPKPLAVDTASNRVIVPSLDAWNVGYLEFRR